MGTNIREITGYRNDRVLVIDDNVTNRTMLGDALSVNGYEIRYAGDGSEGLEEIQRWEPAVVLLDIVMPGMNGINVCREIRKMKLSRRPAIIVVSMMEDKETIVEALASGADDFIVKPVNENEVLARILAQLRIGEFYREIEEDKRNLETILDITSTVTATLDPARVLDIIVKRVAEATDAVRCSIVLIARDDEGYVIATNDDPGVSGLKIDLAKYPEIKEVVNTKVPLALDDILSHPLMEGVRDQIAELRDMSVLIVPIVIKDEVLGTLFLRTRRKEKGFSKKEIDFCRIVANSSFHAIKNARLFEKLTNEKNHLKEIAVKDYLTSLYNHNYFYTRLEEEFDRAVRYETPLSLIMMDIDDFKHVNDTYGHRKGDRVLKEIAAIIKKGVRKTDILARYGGEEFAIILPHTTLEGAVEEAERLGTLIESHAYGGLMDEQITMSIGVGTFPGPGIMNSGDLVNRADDALYIAKRSGKNCVRSVTGGEA